MKGQQALSSVTHTLMRKRNPYRPGHAGAHLCPAKSMLETPIMAAPWAHPEPLQMRSFIRDRIPKHYRFILV